MSKQNKQNQSRLLIPIFGVMLLVGVVILAALKQHPVQQPAPQQTTNAPPPASNEQPRFRLNSAERPTNNKTQKISINNIIKTARTWRPAFTLWFGEMATDFTLTDLNGKQHKLSDYRGKDVLIIFWATWCQPCLMEIPHLTALRNTISEDNLAMLAISNESPALLKKFIGKNKINYTILSSNSRALPAPFSMVNSIPTSFFVNPEGRIKLATSGMISLSEIKAILQAE